MVRSYEQRIWFISPKTIKQVKKKGFSFRINGFNSVKCMLRMKRKPQANQKKQEVIEGLMISSSSPLSVLFPSNTAIPFNIETEGPSFIWTGCSSVILTAKNYKKHTNEQRPAVIKIQAQIINLWLWFCCISNWYGLPIFIQQSDWHFGNSSSVHLARPSLLLVYY